MLNENNLNEFLNRTKQGEAAVLDDPDGVLKQRFEEVRKSEGFEVSALNLND